METWPVAGPLGAVGAETVSLPSPMMVKTESLWPLGLPSSSCTRITQVFEGVLGTVQGWRPSLAVLLAIDIQLAPLLVE